MRLIDADALKDEFCDHCATLKRYKRTVEECRNHIDPYGNGCFKMRYIDSSPTTEADPVVRCMDCRHAIMHIDIIGDPHLFCGLATNRVEMEFDDFCSYGERKEDSRRDRPCRLRRSTYRSSIPPRRSLRRCRMMRICRFDGEWEEKQK